MAYTPEIEQARNLILLMLVKDCELRGSDTPGATQSLINDGLATRSHPRGLLTLTEAGRAKAQRLEKARGQRNGN